MDDNDSSSDESNTDYFEKYYGKSNEEEENEVVDETSDANNNDGNNNEENETSFRGAEHILILLDCHPEMFHSSQELQRQQRQGNRQPSAAAVSEKSPFETGLEACKMLLLYRIRNAATNKNRTKRDSVGVVLFNTRLRKTMDEQYGFDDRGTNDVLLKLEPPGKDHIKKIVQCINKEIDLKSEYCNSKSEDGDADIPDDDEISPLSSALNVANQLYQDAKSVKKTPRSATTNRSNRKNKRDLVKDKKMIWIFTNQDNPCYNSSCLDGQDDLLQNPSFQNLRTIADDVEGNEIEIHVYPLPKMNSTEGENIDGEEDNDEEEKKYFDRSLCYNHITTYQEEPDDQEYNNAQDFLDNFLHSVAFHYTKTRLLFTIPFYLSPRNPKYILVNFYRFTNNNTRLPTPIKIDPNTNLQAKRRREVTVKDTGESLSTPSATASAGPSGTISTYITFGGGKEDKDNRVHISKQEISKIKKACSFMNKSSLTLVGFQKEDLIPLHYFVERAYFIYPHIEDDSATAAEEGNNSQNSEGNSEITNTESSLEGFSNLYNSMMRKKVVAIAQLVTRYGSSVPRLVAVIPQKEEFDNEEEEEGEPPRQITPPGFIVVPLPYKNDIRKIPQIEQKLQQASSLLSPNEQKKRKEELVKLATDMITNLYLRGKIDWSEQYENLLQKYFWEYIESVALDWDSPQQNNDFDEENPYRNEFIREAFAAAEPQIKAFQEALQKIAREDVLLEELEEGKKGKTKKRKSR